MDVSQFESADGTLVSLADGISGAARQFDGATQSVRQFQSELKSTLSFGAEFNRSLSLGVDQLTRGMSNAFEGFLRTGKLSFADLKNVAIDALDSIYDRAISSGLDQIFGGLSGGIGDALGGIFSGGPILSFAPRATGGPVSAGRPFLVGEAGPEIFVPGQFGSVVRPQAAAGASPINVTINMAGNGGGSGSAMRQSASQIAAQVSRAVSRAQRNG